MFYRSVDLIIEGLLGRLLPERAPQRLGRRFQRAAFALAIVLLAVVGTVTLTLQILDQRARTLETHETTLQVLKNDLTTQLDGIADEMRFLSQSPLVWTAFSDSAGRDSYLRPSLRADSARNRATRLTLLDYRGRLIAGGAAPLDPGKDPALAGLVARVMEGRQPLARVPYPSPRLLIAYPVLFPYTGDAIGVLLAEVSLIAQIHGRARSLDDSLGLALGVDGRELLAFPPRNDARSLPLTLSLTSRANPGLYRFDLTLFHRQPTWLAPLANLLLVYLAAAALLIAFTWRATHRLAEGLVGRLENLARAVAARSGPEALPDDPSQDEIGALTRVLRNSLAANRELTQHLEERVAERTRQLADQEAQYRFLAENIKDVVWTLDADSLRFLYVSPSVEGLLGYTVAEVMARPADEGLDAAAADSLRNTVARLAAQCRTGELPADRFHTSVVEQARKDGGRVWTEVITSYRLDEDSGRVVVLGVTRDISERRRWEEMQHFGAFQAGLAEMSGSVLHTVGNTLTSLGNEATILRQKGDDLMRMTDLLRAHMESADGGQIPCEDHRLRDIQRGVLDVLHRLGHEGLRDRAQHMLDHIAGLDRIIRVQEGLARPDNPAAPFDMAEALADALAARQQDLDRLGIQVRVTVDPALGPVTLPRNRLLQALAHGLRNAQEAIQARGPHPEAGLIQLRVEAQGDDRLRILIRDNGDGVAPEARKQLFRLGFSTRAGGSGYGLHAAALFAQGLGGRIALESPGVGQGACLSLELPRHMTPVASMARAPLADAPTEVPPR